MAVLAEAAANAMIPAIGITSHVVTIGMSLYTEMIYTFGTEAIKVTSKVLVHSCQTLHLSHLHEQIQNRCGRKH